MIITIILIILGITLRLLTWLLQRQQPERVPTKQPDLKPKVYGKPQGFARTPIIKPPKQLEIDITPRAACEGFLAPVPKQQRQLIPTPPAPAQPSPASIRQLASQYKYEYDEEIDATKYLYREIMANGGIKAYANDYLAEEFRSNIPTWYRRSNGLCPDEMAETLFYDSDTALLEAISKAEITRQTLKQAKLSFATLLEHARLDLLEELNQPTSSPALQPRAPL